MDKYKISVLNYIFSRVLSFRKAHSCAAKLPKSLYHINVTLMYYVLYL